MNGVFFAGGGAYVLLVYVTDLKVAEGSQIFTTSENRHQIRNSGTTCLSFEVWLLFFYSSIFKMY